MDDLLNSKKRYALSGWPMIIAWIAMLIFAFHATTHMVGAGDTWVAMACGRHFINHGVDTVEPFSANSHHAGPTEEEVEKWPGWAQKIVDAVGLRRFQKIHPTGWVNQNWLTHVIFYWTTHLSPIADGPPDMWDADQLADAQYSYNSLVVWKIILYVLTVICVYYTGRVLGANPALSAAMACAAMFIGRSYFDVRPAGYSNLCTAVFLLILVLSTQRNILYLWLLVPLTVFWCNLHGGYIYVFMMLVPIFGIYFLKELPQRWTVPFYLGLICLALYGFSTIQFLGYSVPSGVEAISVFKSVAFLSDWLLWVSIFLTIGGFLLTFLRDKMDVLFYGYHIGASILSFTLCGIRMGTKQLFENEEILKTITTMRRVYVVLFGVLLIVGYALVFHKRHLKGVKVKGLFHIAAVGITTFVATLIFNPFHLTNFTHTFIISLSKHAKMWKRVHEWHGGFEWKNPVGTGFPFLILFLLLMGMVIFWLYSRFVSPSLSKGKKEQSGNNNFYILSAVLGWIMVIYLVWALFVSLSFCPADFPSFLMCSVVISLLILCINMSVHFIYLLIPVIFLLAYIKKDYPNNVALKWIYIWPFVIVPLYVLLHSLMSKFYKKIRYSSVNISLVLGTALVSVVVLLWVDNPFGFKSFGDSETIGSYFAQYFSIRRPWRPPYEANLPLLSKGYNKHLFNVLYVINGIALSLWLIVPLIKKYAVHLSNSVNKGRLLNILKMTSVVTFSMCSFCTVILITFVSKNILWDYSQSLKVLFIVLSIVGTSTFCIFAASLYMKCLIPSTQLSREQQEGHQEQVDVDAGPEYKFPKIDLVFLAITFLTVKMAYDSRRFIPIAAMAACPILAMFITQICRGMNASFNFYKSGRFVVSSISKPLEQFFIYSGLVLTITFGLWWGVQFKQVYLDPWGTHTKFTSVFMRMTASHVKPFMALQFIRDNNITGNMFNYWTEGGFIAYGQYPDSKTGRTGLQLFMDGRAQAAYEPEIFIKWNEVMACTNKGAHLIETTKKRGRSLNKKDYLQLGSLLDKQFQNDNVWVILLPTNDKTEIFIKSMQTHPDWEVVFYNNAQMLLVNKRTERGKELYDGVFSGETKYPDEFSRHLTKAYNLINTSVSNKNLDLAKSGLKEAKAAFALEPGRASIVEILKLTNKFGALSPEITKMCVAYIEDFEQNKKQYKKQHGYRMRLVAAIYTANYISGHPNVRKDPKALEYYSNLVTKNDKEQRKLHYMQSW